MCEKARCEGEGGSSPPHCAFKLFNIYLKVDNPAYAIVIFKYKINNITYKHCKVLVKCCAQNLKIIKQEFTIVKTTDNILTL